MPIKVHDDERGIALVVAMLVMMVVLMLSIAVVQIAQGENLQAANNRKTVDAADVADTALASYVAQLPTSSGSDLCTNYDAATRQANGMSPDISLPSSGYPLTYRLDVTFTSTTGVEVPCSSFVGQYTIQSANIIATGYAGTATTNSSKIARKFKMAVTLTPIPGAGVTTAVYAACNLTIANNKKLWDNPAGSYNANVYSGCDIDWQGGNGSKPWHGSLIAYGNITLAGGYLGGNVWAKGNIVGQNPCVGVHSDDSCGYGQTPATWGPGYSGTALDTTGWVVSTKGNIQMNGWMTNGCVAPNGTITPSNGQGAFCMYRDWDGGSAVHLQSDTTYGRGYSFFPSGYACPAAAANVSLLGRNLCQDPPAINFPTWSYNSQDWVGYTVFPHTLDAAGCTAAHNAIVAGFATNELVDLRGMTPDCNLSFNVNIPVNHNLGIITEGAVNFQSTTWTAQASCNPAPCKLMVVHPTTETAGTLNSCPFNLPGTATQYGADAPDDISFSSSATFSGLQTMFYTPCAIDLQNSTDFTGQAIGGSVTTANNGQLYFAKVTVPGLSSQPVGYSPTVMYTAEIPHT